MNKITEQFASDNYSGICPEVWEAMQKANICDVPAYGEDPWTEKATNRFREIFEKDCDVFFVFNGTAANALALSSLSQSYHSVLCSDFAHIETDECGAPEFFSNGAKLWPVKSQQGKINITHAEQMICRRSDIHYPKPKIISITQSTELGTLYTPSELLSIKELAKRYQLKVHMDGARFSNAVASIGCSPAELSWKAGVDVLCFGGTKNGMGMGEAVVFFDKNLAEDFAYRCKQAGQLASKMRYISASWLGLLDHDIWLKNASHANAMAQKLALGIKAIPNIELMFPTEANAVFMQLPQHVLESLRKEGWIIYSFIGAGGARLMCSWSTTEARIHQFLGALQKAIQR